MAISDSMANGDNNNSSNNMSSINMSSTMMNTDSKMDKNYSLVNMTDFQSAQALAAKALEIFNTELRPMAPKNETGFVSNLVYLFGKISMAHFNPVVTLGFLITKQITKLQLVYYFTAEILGALLGSLFVMYIIGREANLGAN